jgi:hypothetical protein
MKQAFWPVLILLYKYCLVAAGGLPVSDGAEL